MRIWESKMKSTWRRSKGQLIWVNRGRRPILPVWSTSHSNSLWPSIRRRSSYRRSLRLLNQMIWESIRQFSLLGSVRMLGCLRQCIRSTVSRRKGLIISTLPKASISRPSLISRSSEESQERVRSVGNSSSDILYSDWVCRWWRRIRPSNLWGNYTLNWII